MYLQIITLTNKNTALLSSLTLSYYRFDLPEPPSNNTAVSSFAVKSSAIALFSLHTAHLPPPYTHKPQTSPHQTNLLLLLPLLPLLLLL
jgi:hypothetical protein